MMGPVVSGPVNNRARAVGGPKEGEEELQREGCLVRFVCPEAVIARGVREGAEKGPDHCEEGGLDLEGDEEGAHEGGEAKGKEENHPERL